MSALIASIGDAFYGWPLAVLAVAVIVFELVVVVMAADRRRSGRAPLSLTLHAIGGALMVVLPVAVGISVHTARLVMFAAYVGSGLDPSAKGAALAQGMAGQRTAMLFGVSATLLAVVLWLVGMAATLRRPRLDGRAGAFPPVLLVPLGLLLTAVGVLVWNIDMEKMFADLPGKPPEDKGAIVAGALDVARHQLTFLARGSMMGIALLAVIAVVLILRRARGENVVAGAITRRRSAALPIALSAAAIALSGVLVLAARPMAAENDLPWPPPLPGGQIIASEPPTPDLVGPDLLERAPVVLVHRDRLGLDGTSGEDLQSLEDKLVTLRINYRLLHPSEYFNELAVVVADPSTPIPRLRSVLAAIRAAEYHEPIFAFGKTETLDRPLFGGIRRVSSTGARVRLAYTDGKDDDEFDDDTEAAAWKDAVLVPMDAFPDYEALARRLVELRRSGQRILLRVDRPRH